MTPGSAPHERQRPEPQWFTMGDLLGLVVGAALASATLWFLSWDDPRGIGSPSSPWWLTALQLLCSGSYRAGLVLVPVVLARRANYGGVVRAAEFPIGNVGIPFLFVGLQHWPALGVLVSNGPGRGFLFTSETAYWINFLAHLSIGLMAFLAVVFGRRKLPGWALTLCLWLAWMGIQQTEGLWTPGINHFLMELESYRLRRWLSLGLIQFPWSFTVAIPMAAAIRGMLGPRAQPRTWVEWVGVVLIPMLYLPAECIFLAERFAIASLSRVEFATELAATIALDATSLILSLYLVGRIGPRWSRWLGNGYDGGMPTPDRKARER